MASHGRLTQQSSAPASAPAPAQAASSSAFNDTEKLNVSISSLMSPPDPILNTFDSRLHDHKHDYNNQHHVHQAQSHAKHDSSAMTPLASASRSAARHPLPMSPPISPYSKPILSADPPTTPPTQAIRDPLLYPSEDASPASSLQVPLFAPAELESHQRVVDDYLRHRSHSIFTGVAPPRREDYELALTFRSQVMRHYTSNRKAWLRKERALLAADRLAGAQRYRAVMPAKPIASKPARTHRGDRVQKPQTGRSNSAPRPIRAHAATAPAGPMRPAVRASATPEPSRRIVAPNREDKDFQSLPDYCPPLESLPRKPNCLKVDWKGQPIDLTGDHYEHLLHPDEVLLAGNLRLDCATYLTSKRRVFERRLQCLRSGKEFRKTDAQQACKIDVNKASKLWTAFDKVGWLDAHWVRRFL